MKFKKKKKKIADLISQWQNYNWSLYNLYKGIKDTEEKNIHKVFKMHALKMLAREIKALVLGSDDGVSEATLLIYIHEALGNSFPELQFTHS